MELSTLQRLLPTPTELIEAVKAEKYPIVNAEGKAAYGYELGIKQYDPAKHAIKDKAKRPDKFPMLPSGECEADGTPKLVRTQVVTTRMAMPIQKYIIDQRASFAVGNKIELKPSIPDSPIFEAVQGQWKKNKIHYLLKDVARRQMAETEVAVIFYSDPKEKPKTAKELRLRAKVVSPSNGSVLYPVFDEMDDLIAFGREYEVDKKKRFDLYTSTQRITYDSHGKVLDMINLPYNGKIPVIYWRQDRPECDNVQDIIEARETIQSDFFDTNTRIGDPIMVLKGSSVNLPAAGTPGKVLEITGDNGDAKFISPTNSTEARKLEFEMLDDLIYSLTRTVKLSPENLKGLGIESGAAMDRILIASHMAAKDMQDGEFGMGIQRMLNFLIHVYSDVLSNKDGLEIEPVFTLFRIDDASERVELAMKANGNKPIISHKNSIQQAGFTDDAEAEYQAIQDEADEATPMLPKPNVVPISVAK